MVPMSSTNTFSTGGSSDEKSTTFTEAEQKRLIQLARAAIEFGFKTGHQPSTSDLQIDNLDSISAHNPCFVTLEKNQDLRGCIGTLSYDNRRLIDNVVKYAYAAAFEDYRFHPVTTEEWQEISVEISVLSEPESIDVRSEEDLLQKLTPKQDGLILESGSKRATFLPAVWDQLSDKKEFVTQLKRKAGIAIDDWPSNMKCSLYQAVKISE